MRRLSRLPVRRYALSDDLISRERAMRIMGARSARGGRDGGTANAIGREITCAHSRSIYTRAYTYMYNEPTRGAPRTTDRTDAERDCGEVARRAPLRHSFLSSFVQHGSETTQLGIPSGADQRANKVPRLLSDGRVPLRLARVPRVDT